jgi:hypothetical protein
MSQQSESRKEFEASIVARAEADPAFREALLSNAKATIEKELGVALPAELEWRALEETPMVRYLVLPARGDGEMSELEIEGVTGGINALGAVGVMKWGSKVSHEISQDVTVNKAKTADKAFQAMDSYIRG